MLYYLADRTYLNWAAFVKSISYAAVSHNEKEKVFANAQQAARKDIKILLGASAFDSKYYSTRVVFTKNTWCVS